MDIFKSAGSKNNSSRPVQVAHSLERSSSKGVQSMMEGQDDVWKVMGQEAVHRLEEEEGQ